MPNKPDQLTADQVALMRRAGLDVEIEQARLDGRLDDVLGIERHRPPADAQWTHADVTAMFRERRHDEIEAARRDGKLADLLADSS